MVWIRLYWIIIKKLRSLSFSIGLFISIAVFSMLGTFIEQNKPIDYYKINYPSNISLGTVLNWKVIQFFGINNVYSSYFFIILVVLFFCTLLVCTFSTQLPLLRYSRQWKFLYNFRSIVKKSYSNQGEQISAINWIALLIAKNYYVFQKGRAVYAYKGLIGRVSPIFVHFSLILTMLGPLIGHLSGFSVQEMIPISEISHLQNFVSSGNFSQRPGRIYLEVDDFFLSYNEDSSIQQFFAKLSIYNDNYEKLIHKYISVNHPLQYSGLTIYQTNWQINALRIQFGSHQVIEKPVQLSNFDRSNSTWLCEVNFGKKKQVFVTISNFDDRLSIYNSEGSLIVNTSYGIWNMIYGVPILFKEVMFSTGLQVKLDPGVTITYFGFGLLMINIVLSYISYSQIWLVMQMTYFYFGGDTNRASVFFEDEMVQILTKYKNLLNTLDKKILNN